jgi:hypothetical protein
MLYSKVRVPVAQQFFFLETGPTGLSFGQGEKHISILLVNMPVRCYGFFLRSFRLLENDFVFFLIELAEVNYRLLLSNIKEQ